MATQYSIQKEFELPPKGNGQYRAITVKANGGSVSLEIWDGVEWVETGDSWSETGSYTIFIDGALFRVTPTGGATYSWSN